MSSRVFSGVLPAVVTPIRADGGLAVRSFELLIERMYDAGASGIYVCGQTGEGLSLPLEVRRAATEVAVQNTPAGKHAIIHVGASNTIDALVLARHAARCGAHGISSLPPGSSYSFDEVKSYYEAIAASANVPVLVYYFPDFSKSVSTLEQMLELCSIPGVVGLKYTDFDLYRLSQVRRAGPIIFNGRDEVFAAGLLMGADGGIGSFYNLVPELFVRVYDLARSGKWDEARSVQDRINSLIQMVLKFPMLAAIKHLLTLSGIDCGIPMPPRRALTEAEVIALREAASAVGYSVGSLSEDRITGM